MPEQEVACGGGQLRRCIVLEVVRVETVQRRIEQALFLAPLIGKKAVESRASCVARKIVAGRAPVDEGADRRLTESSG